MSLPSIICCFCDKDAGQYGNNPEPLANGRKFKCCDDCNANRVIPARLLGIKVPKSSGIAMGTPKGGGAPHLIGPITYGGGTTLPTECVDENIVLDGSQCYLTDVMVGTTRTAMEGMLKLFREDKATARRAFCVTWNIIKQADTDALYAEEGHEGWKALMETIADYYAARCALFGSPIPIITDPRARHAINSLKANDAFAGRINIPEEDDDTDEE